MKGEDCERLRYYVSKLAALLYGCRSIACPFVAADVRHVVATWDRCSCVSQALELYEAAGSLLVRMAIKEKIDISPEGCL